MSARLVAWISKISGSVHFFEEDETLKQEFWIRAPWLDETDDAQLERTKGEKR